MFRRFAVSCGICTLVFLFFSLNWASADAKKLTPDELEKAKALYATYCSQCHGDKGRGDGPAAAFVYPKPRDFKRGLYKIRTTPSGKIPTDEDLFRVITEGMPGTSMNAWRRLSDEERWLLAYYIKTFSRRLSRARKSPEPITIGEPIPMTSESIQRGEEIFNKMECGKCHGDEGRGDGPSAPTLKDKWDFPIRPGNLKKSWNFRGGNRREDIYKNIMVGITGTPMP
ncbi:MAG: cytochrome c, partial [Desulfatiglandales bacterium]